MSSTYSPDLRIELIGPGEQAGVWNTTTNTNLGTLVEDAIAGYISVSITSANQALTASNGVADQSRNAIIALSTTTGANFAVYAPPASKQYIIYNTSAYTATIYNSTVLGNTTAAGLGVAVPAGKKITVFSNGTNFRAIEATDLIGVLPVVNGGTGVSTSTGTGNTVLSTSPTLVTPILGTPTSGTLTNCTGLPVSTGVSGLATGMAAFLATPSSANFAATLTDETGTGSNVFATSPTLVTPILGTPTSGTLTNCTGLPVASGISGLATGMAAFLATPSSANFAATLTDETGTGSNVFATSPTLVTPLLGTPTSGTLTNCTGLPIASGVSGLGTGVATFLATPSSANLLSAVTGETGTGALVFATSPTLVTPLLGTPTSGVLTNCTGTASGLTAGTVTTNANLTGAVTSVGNATSLGSFTSLQLLTALTDETGTGANVFATSPTLTSATLVTPALGTPTSGTLDSCTSNTEAFGTSNTQLATTAFVQAALAALHPVGSIYTSTAATNPGTALGFGTWVAFGAGRVLIGNGGGFTAGATGGSADAIVVTHDHSFSATTSSASLTGTLEASKPSAASGIVSVQATGVGGGADGSQASATRYAIDASHSHTLSGTTGSAGASGTNANLQPYVVVYMWNRTA